MESGKGVEMGAQDQNPKVLTPEQRDTVRKLMELDAKAAAASSINELALLKAEAMSLPLDGMQPEFVSLNETVEKRLKELFAHLVSEKVG